MPALPAGRRCDGAQAARWTVGKNPYRLEKLRLESAILKDQEAHRLARQMQESPR